jgi:regulatory protein
VTEVRRRLRSAGYRPDLVDGAIERLQELGILDDEAFARSWVESRDRARPRAERAIREELRVKGVDRTTIDAVLEERRGGEDAEPDRDAAQRLIERNERSLARVADPRQRRARAYALLARNGFDPDVCREVAARVVDLDGSEATPESR